MKKYDKIADLTNKLLEEIGEDPKREGLIKTPLRVAKAWKFFSNGYKQNLDDIINNAIFNEDSKDMVVVRDVEFFSLCEHHLLPFFGKAHVAYIPDGKVIGLSKIPRIIDMFSRRLQVQERLTRQISETVKDVLEPVGVAVIMEGQHMCMQMRGVEKQSRSSAASDVYKRQEQSFCQSLAYEEIHMAVTYNILDLGKSHYNDAWKLQKRLQSQRISGQIDDQLLLVEHFPVYTLGKNTPREHLLTKESDNISIIQTDRGGDITFHGPGQLVGYPILDLNQYKRSITWYMRELEQLIIDVLKEYDINAERKKGLTGVWGKGKKIAALGVRISKWVTMHGFSLNINPDLKYYQGIIPCGIKDYGVTSMADLLGNDVPDMSEIKETLVQHFIAKFSIYKN